MLEHLERMVGTVNGKMEVTHLFLESGQDWIAVHRNSMCSLRHFRSV
jgi:hypothetical protein